MAQKIVLVVDDASSTTQLLKAMLEVEGYEIAMAENGREGLALTRGIKPDLVILDVVMPEMDGYEVLQTLKGDPATKDIPVVMLTARRDDEAIQEGLDLGAADYIPKPFEPDILIKKVQTIIQGL